MPIGLFGYDVLPVLDAFVENIKKQHTNYKQVWVLTIVNNLGLFSIISVLYLGLLKFIGCGTSFGKSCRYRC
jgi:hypothetical protein